MPRVARVVIADVAHHITQRGNGRQFILSSDSDRMVFMDLLRQAVEGRELSLVGYCLMSNHLHRVEAQTHRRLIPGPPGRPRKKSAELNRLAPAALTGAK